MRLLAQTPNFFAKGRNTARLASSEQDTEHTSEAQADFCSAASRIPIVEENNVGMLIDSKTESGRFSGMESHPNGDIGRMLQWGDAQPTLTECRVE